MVQNDDIKTDDEGTSAEIESIMSEVDTAATPFADREKRSIHANSHNERRSVIDGSVSVTVTRSLETEQHKGSDDPAEVEEQEWEITEILEKRAAGSETEYRVRWKDTWLLRSELGSAQGLLKKFEAKGRAQHGRKRGRPARTDKG